tara:strand:+ start:1113 stop:3197 length:2085 start_codon:yes stop_codon:yes gene_type:complete
MNKVLAYIRNQHHMILKIAMFVFAIGLIVAIFPRSQKFKFEFQLSKPWQHVDLIAPFDFPIYKTSEDLAEEKNNVLSNQAVYFHKNSAIGEEVLVKYQEEFDSKWNQVIANYSAKVESFRDNKDQFYQIGLSFLKKVYQSGIIEQHSTIESQPGSFEIMVLENNNAKKVELKSLYQIQSIFDAFDKNHSTLNREELDILKSILVDFLEINVKYDQATNEYIKEQELSKISPSTGLVQSGEKIISKGELVNDNKFKILSSLKKEYSNQLGNQKQERWILLGHGLLVSLIIFTLGLFLYSFRRDIFDSDSKIVFLLFLILLFVLLSKLVLDLAFLHIYLIPFCILPLIIRTFFDTRLAVFSFLIMVLLVGFIAPNPFEFVVIQLIAGIITLFTIRNLQRRGQFFLVALLVFALYSLVYLALELIQEATLSNINWKFFAWFFGSGLILLFTYPLIYLFEKIFGLVSDVTLMELADTNRRLLRKLNTKAPGTFQHSLQVANLAEEAIRTIGGNALLVRTGALYHDIGKMNMPNYFIENQNSDYNPHDEISPEESAVIIIDHVIHGIELARRYKLPDILIDFIRTHHGTSTIRFFWKKFQNENPDVDLDEDLFRYPGPIPYSKETAVLMMADSVEAASRSLKNYDAESIENLIEGIISNQIEEKQFIHSDITFRDILQIKKIFKKRLMNIYHVRMAYPS